MSKKPFVTKEQVEEIVKTYPTPFHLYDEKGIRENAKALKEAFAWNPGYKEYFAVKATPNPYLLKILKDYDMGCDCSSYTELMLAKSCGFDGEHIMFSSNDTPAEEFAYADKLGAIINLDDFTHIDFLEETIGHIPETISCRYNPGGVFTLSNGIMDNPGDSKYGMTKEQLFEMLKGYGFFQESTSTYEDNMSKLGYAELAKPASINLYCAEFADKDEITKLIDKYNEDYPDKEITYTDYIGIMLSSVTKIINAITYVLIAFVAISLIVSSIMIGIITYISVLERTKEIGILRSIGASKKDISRVFNAETFIIGLFSGLIGIGVTVLINIPISKVIESYINVAGVSALPWKGGVILVIISVILTLIGGLIPSRLAAKKDPVIALRSE